jgi:hypothetical protein
VQQAAEGLNVAKVAARINLGDRHHRSDRAGA